MFWQHFWQNSNNRLKQESTPFNLLKWSVYISYVLGLFRTSWVRWGGCELIRGSTTEWLADQDEHIIKMLIKGQDLSHLLLATKSDVHLVHLVSDPPSCRIHEQIIMDGGRGQGMMIGLLDTFKVKGDERREEKKKKSHKCCCVVSPPKWVQMMPRDALIQKGHKWHGHIRSTARKEKIKEMKWSFFCGEVQVT